MINYKTVKQELTALVMNSMDREERFVKPLRMKYEREHYYLVPFVSVNLDTLYDDELVESTVDDYLSIGGWVDKELALVGTFPAKCKITLSLCFIVPDFVTAHNMAVGLGERLYYDSNGLRVSTANLGNYQCAGVIERQ